jgi:hypothetical protein
MCISPLELKLQIKLPATRRLRRNGVTEKNVN